MISLSGALGLLLLSFSSPRTGHANKASLLTNMQLLPSRLQITGIQDSDHVMPQPAYLSVTFLKKYFIHLEER